MQLGAWLLDVFPGEIVTHWEGDDANRARLVASIASIGTEAPTDVVRFLLDQFGGDRRVASSLSSTFISGFWSGNETDRLARKIEQLNSWRRSEEPLGVRNWAAEMIDHLERDRQAALEREAERGF
jgi:hypothetical protein